MSKRLWSLILVLVLGLTVLIGCGKGQNQADTTLSQLEIDFRELATIQATANRNGDMVDLLHDFVSFDNTGENDFFANAVNSRIVKNGELFSNSVSNESELNEIWEGLNHSTKCNLAMALYSGYLTRNSDDTFRSMLGNMILSNYVDSWYTGTPEDYATVLNNWYTDYYSSIDNHFSELSYATCGNYLGVDESVLYSNLVVLGKDETVLTTYLYKGAVSSKSYGDNEGNSYILPDYTTYTVYVLGSKGTVLAYKYAGLGSDIMEDCVLLDAFYLFGGGTLAGMDDSLPTVENVDNLFFFGSRSMGSLSLSEVARIMRAFTNACYDEVGAYSAIEENCGCKLVGNYNFWLYDDLTRYEINGRSFELDTISCGKTVQDTNSVYGDMYAIYRGSIASANGTFHSTLQGLSIIHSREYGFSGENYIRMF